MKLETKFNIGQKVQLVTDEEKKMRLITHITVFYNMYIQYMLACGTESTPHSECEIMEYQEPEKNHVAGFAPKIS